MKAQLVFTVQYIVLFQDSHQIHNNYENEDLVYTQYKINEHLEISGKLVHCPYVLRFLTINTQLSVEPLYSRHHWEPTLCPLLRGVPNSGFWYISVGMVCIIRLFRLTFFGQSFHRFQCQQETIHTGVIFCTPVTRTSATVLWYCRVFTQFSLCLSVRLYLSSDANLLYTS